MSWLKLTITGIPESISAADYAQAKMLQYTAEVFQWFGETVTEAAKTDHPYRDHTGTLTNSIGFTVESWSSGTAQVNIFALASYADEVEFGTGKSVPYPFIFPKFYQYLDEAMTRLQAAVDRAFSEAGQISGVTVR
jgi:hypothetical protein